MSTLTLAPGGGRAGHTMGSDSYGVCTTRTWPFFRVAELCTWPFLTLPQSSRAIHMGLYSSLASCLISDKLNGSVPQFPYLKLNKSSAYLVQF